MVYEKNVSFCEVRQLLRMLASKGFLKKYDVKMKVCKFGVVALKTPPPQFQTKKKSINRVSQQSVPSLIFNGVVENKTKKETHRVSLLNLVIIQLQHILILHETRNWRLLERKQKQKRC